MVIVINGCKGRTRYPELATEPRPLVAPLSSPRIDDIVEVWICKMDFLGVDSYNGTILLVQLSDLEGVLPFQPNIIVEFVPERCKSAQSLHCSWIRSPSLQH